MVFWVYIYVANFFSMMDSYGLERHSLLTNIVLTNIKLWFYMILSFFPFLGLFMRTEFFVLLFVKYYSM
jgi:hypothetical protein